jgi:hypothetical protein
MVATKALTGSTPLAWVNVATVPLNLLAVVVMGAETTIAGSATLVLALALLSPGVGSAAPPVTEPLSVRVPSSVA